MMAGGRGRGYYLNPPLLRRQTSRCSQLQLHNQQLSYSNGLALISTTNHTDVVCKPNILCISIINEVSSHDEIEFQSEQRFS